MKDINTMIKERINKNRNVKKSWITIQSKGKGSNYLYDKQDTYYDTHEYDMSNENDIQELKRIYDIGINGIAFDDLKEFYYIDGSEVSADELNEYLSGIFKNKNVSKMKMKKSFPEFKDDLSNAIDNIRDAFDYVLDAMRSLSSVMDDVQDTMNGLDEEKDEDIYEELDSFFDTVHDLYFDLDGIKEDLGTVEMEIENLG